MKHKEVLKLALNALNRITHRFDLESVAEDATKAITAIEEALAQPEHEHVISKDAYDGAREDLAIWKKRALEAEELNRKFIAEINGPTYMGEPVKPDPEQKPVTPFGLPLFWDAPAPLPDGSLINEGTKNIEQEPVAWGNLANWCLDSDRVLITDKDEAAKYHRDVYDLTPLYTTPPQRKPLFKNVHSVSRYGDMSITLVFRSCASASEFIEEAAHGIKVDA